MAEVIVVASNALDAARVLAQRAAARGASVAVLTGSHQPLSDVAGKLVQAGAPSVLAIPCNLTDPEAVAAAARRVERELGPIDRWLNTAMTDLRYVCATRAALDCMRTRDRGSIVQVSAPRSVRIYTDALRAELRLAGSHVHVDTVRTYPFRRIGAAAMAAATVVGALLLKRLVR